MVLDGAGGVFVMFEDVTNNDLYVQHALSNGHVDPVWPSIRRFGPDGPTPVKLADATANAEPGHVHVVDLAVAFSLSGASAARLEVMDLAGRREFSRELAGLEPGRHTLALADARLAPGVHWLRLSEGAQSAHARVVVVR